MAKESTSPFVLALLGVAGAGLLVIWDAVGGAKGVSSYIPTRPVPPSPKASGPAAPEWAERAIPEPPAGVPLRPPPPINILGAGTRNPHASGGAVDAPAEPDADPTPGVPHVVTPQFRRYPGYVATPFADGFELKGDWTYQVPLPAGTYGGFHARLRSFHGIHDRLQGVGVRFFVSLGGAEWRALPPIPLGGTLVRFTTATPFDRLRAFLTSHRAEITLDELTVLDAKAPGEALPGDRELLVDSVGADTVVVRAGAETVALPAAWISAGPPHALRIAPPDGSGIFHALTDGWTHWDLAPPDAEQSQRMLSPPNTPSARTLRSEAWLWGAGAWTLFARTQGHQLVDTWYDGELGAIVELRESGQADLTAGAKDAGKSGYYLRTAEERRAVIAALARPDESPADGAGQAVRKLRAGYAKHGQGPAFDRFVGEALRQVEERLRRPAPLRVGERLLVAPLCFYDRDAWRVPLEFAAGPADRLSLSGPGAAAVDVPRALHPPVSLRPGQTYAIYRPELPVVTAGTTSAPRTR